MSWWRREREDKTKDTPSSGGDPRMPLIRLEGVSKVFQGDEAEEATHARGRGARPRWNDRPCEAAPKPALRRPPAARRHRAGDLRAAHPFSLPTNPPATSTKTGDGLMQMLAELHADGATVCLATHDPRYIAQAPRHIYLFDGRVVDSPV